MKLFRERLLIHLQIFIEHFLCEAQCQLLSFEFRIYLVMARVGTISGILTQTNCLAFLCFFYPICKMGIIIAWEVMGALWWLNELRHSSVYRVKVLYMVTTIIFFFKDFFYCFSITVVPIFPLCSNLPVPLSIPTVNSHTLSICTGRSYLLFN